jgi:hypothetical protein
MTATTGTDRSSYLAQTIRKELDDMTAKVAESKQAVAEDRNSDWALMDDLASAYAQAPVIFIFSKLFGQFEDGAVSISDFLLELNSYATDQLINGIRFSVSSSMGSNMIDVARQVEWKKLIEKTRMWIMFIKH